MLSHQPRAWHDGQRCLFICEFVYDILSGKQRHKKMTIKMYTENILNRRRNEEMNDGMNGENKTEKVEYAMALQNRRILQFTPSLAYTYSGWIHNKSVTLYLCTFDGNITLWNVQEASKPKEKKIYLIFFGLSGTTSTTYMCVCTVHAP